MTANVPMQLDQQISNMLHFSDEKKTLIKRMYCKDCTNDEFELFLNVCQHTGLDPTLKQIYAIKRKSKDGLGQMTIQTSIDGLRLIADRSGNYVPGKEPIFTYDKQGKLFSATSFIKKRTKDGNWHEVSATAICSEYRPKYTNDFWDTKPHLMTAKCAEALALRKAFPAEMAGVYTEDEMHQVEIDVTPKHESKEPISAPKQLPKLDSQSINELLGILESCPEVYKQEVTKFMTTQGIAKFEDLPKATFDKILKRSQQALEEYKNTQDTSFPAEVENESA